MNLPVSFEEAMRQLLGEGYVDFREALLGEPAVSIRLNKSKCTATPSYAPVPWATDSYYLPERPSFTFDPLFHAGCYYVQEASSMFVEQAVKQHLQEARVALDLCAAPGGKSTLLRSLLPEDCVLISNEVMRPRAQVLAENITKWGHPRCIVTSNYPTDFTPLGEIFDLILVDAPCSGEGMFRKDEEAQRQWSEDNVALCESRQRRIVADVWPALKQGGVFLYSTCTFNKYENDGNVRWISSELEAECLFADDTLDPREGVIKTELGYSLVPGHVEGEGQYCSALRKLSEVEFRETRHQPSRNSKIQAVTPEVASGLLVVESVFRLRGETLIAVPRNISSELNFLESALHVIAAGCAVGTLKGKVLVPDADLALSLAFDRSAFPEKEVDRATALAYLHRDAIVLSDAPKGYVTIVYEGLPLGFVKNLGNRCNSLHPQSRRIRMNIK